MAGTKTSKGGSSWMGDARAINTIATNLEKTGQAFGSLAKRVRASAKGGAKGARSGTKRKTSRAT